jgi:hypothetical protein
LQSVLGETHHLAHARVVETLFLTLKLLDGSDEETSGCARVRACVFVDACGRA